MSPYSSMKALASSPGRADPLTATTRSDEVSYFRLTLSGSFCIRCSITGTTAMAVGRCWVIAASAFSGSKRRCRT